MHGLPVRTRSSPRTARSRGWRSVLAGLISLALALSFFHGWTPAGDDDTARAAPIVGSINASDDRASNDKAPAHPASLHGDHCLTHVTSVAPQETAFSIEYATHVYGESGMQLLASADRLSPFEPPRA
jgi:hypothetical protein